MGDQFGNRDSDLDDGVGRTICSAVLVLRLSFSLCPRPRVSHARCFLLPRMALSLSPTARTAHTPRRPQTRPGRGGSSSAFRPVNVTPLLLLPIFHTTNINTNPPPVSLGALLAS